LGCPYISFGDYVRFRARKLLGCTAPTRQFLQDLGQELAGKDPESFCRDVLSVAALIPERPIVVDGLRHIALLPVLRTLLGGKEIRLIFVEATPEARIERWDGQITRQELSALDSHPMVADLALLRENADLIVETQSGFEDAFEKLIQWITRTFPSLEQHGTREIRPGPGSLDY
jgi:hypothetical protein